jgi:hypothetical protein
MLPQGFIIINSEYKRGPEVYKVPKNVSQTAMSSTHDLKLKDPKLQIVSCMVLRLVTV